MRMNSVLIKACWLSLGMVISITVLAAVDKYREIDWAKELGLSAAQQQQIKTLEHQYRLELKTKNQQERCRNQSQPVAQEVERQQRLHQDLHNILSPAQNQSASAIMYAQHKVMRINLARDIAAELNLAVEPTEEFIRAVAEQGFDYQWPLDMLQREQARERFEQLLQQHLSAEQWQQWQLKAAQDAAKWHPAQEYEPGCKHAAPLK